MIKRIISISLLLAWYALLSAQGIFNNGSVIVIGKDATVLIAGGTGHFTNARSDTTNGEVILDGTMTINGGFYNQSTGPVFAGSDTLGNVNIEDDTRLIHEISGTGITSFENLYCPESNSFIIPKDVEVHVKYIFNLSGNLELNGDLYIEGCFVYNGLITGTGAVHYVSSTPQIVAAGCYPKLVLDNPGGLILEDSVFVAMELVLEKGSLTLGNYKLVLGPECVVVESKAPGTWVDATGTGMMIKMFDKTGIFEFPIGNFGANPVYSPVEIHLLSAIFNAGQIAIRLKADVHPDNSTGANFPNYLKRYWEVESSGLTDFSYNAKFYYDSLDVEGDESGIEGAKLIDSLMLWKHFAHVDTVGSYFEAVGLNSFSVFTGVQENRKPLLSITNPIEGISVYDTTITVSGTASDIDGDLRKVYVRQNEGAWHLATGKENWSFEASLCFGNKKIEAKAMDFQDAESAIDDNTIFAGVQMISLFDYWSHFSSFLDPIQSNIETIMEYPVSQNLLNLMVNNSGGIYWPSQNINHIGNWNYKTAYKICIEEQGTILFKGDLLGETSFQLAEGPRYLPVLSNVEVAVEDAFENPMDDILVMFNHVTNEIYWPDGGIFTLNTLKPGEGYLVNLINPVVVNFPDYDLWTDGTKTEIPVFEKTGPWHVSKTGDVHFISLFTSTLEGLDNYSHIGAFNNMGNCIGFADITKKGSNILLTVYGDDTFTAFKDGAEVGEFIPFRAFNPHTGFETILEANYSKDFPNYDGLFALKGLSGIIEFKVSATAIINGEFENMIQIYPNPAREELYLIIAKELETSTIEIEFMDVTGSIVKILSIEKGNNKINIADLKPGIYVIKITIPGFVMLKKLIVQ